MDLTGYNKVTNMVVSFISQAELAALLCVSLKTLQNRLSERPLSLPTPIRFEGAKSPVWHPKTVAAWQDSLLTGSSYTNAALSAAPAILVKRGRGRPSNSERAARGEFNARA